MTAIIKGTTKQSITVKSIFNKPLPFTTYFTMPNYTILKFLCKFKIP